MSCRPDTRGQKVKSTRARTETNYSRHICRLVFNAVIHRGVATGGISGYIPPKISPPKIFMGYFFLHMSRSINSLQLVEAT